MTGFTPRMRGRHAALEALDKNVLYYENIEGGHGGAANNDQRAFMTSLAYTFLWNELTKPDVPSEPDTEDPPTDESSN